MASATPTSPQKRVTRSRAAANKSIEDPNTSDTQPTLKQTTQKKREAAQQKPIDGGMPEGPEPLRKSARRVGTAATATATSARRIKITPLNSSTTPQQPAQEEDNSSLAATKKPRATRSKRPAGDEAKIEEKADVEGRAKSNRQASNKIKDTPNPPAPKSRGRPKKTEDAQTEVIAETVATRQTRARSGSAAKNTRALAVAPSRTTALKKKVTFQDLPELDKENQPMVKAKTTTKTTSTIPGNGIRAKPIRRPAATSKAKPRQKAAETTEITNQRVLTPKKITQVAKSSSPADSDKDELNGAKTPIRDLSQSPKRNVNMIRTAPPVKMFDFNAVTLASSPVKSQPSQTLSSPARRPAPSPFKDALKESPKRGDFFPNLAQLQRRSEAEVRGSTLSSSSTTLLQSPKRVALDNPFFPQSSSKFRTSPSKASLLQSPPKRPTSPEKAPRAPKSDILPATPTLEVDADMMSPDVTVSSHFKSYQPAKRSSRVHRMSSKDIAEEVKSVIDFDASVVDIRSPLKLEGNNVNVFEEVEEESYNLQVADIQVKDHQRPQLGTHSAMQDEDTVLADEVSPQLMEDVDVRTAAPTSIMLRNETPANPTAFLFRTSRFGDDDESSEDELQSPVRCVQAKTPTTSNGTDFRLLGAGAAFGEKPGFTPLATQLSGWLASSPDKQPTKKYQQRGIFSPVAAQHVPGEVIIDRQSPATSRISMEPSYSAVQRQSRGGRKSFGLRSSLAVSVEGSPDKSTYFADEMAVKDLETEIQNMQARSLGRDETQAVNDAEMAQDDPDEQTALNERAPETEVNEAEEMNEQYQSEDQMMEGIIRSPLDNASRDLSTGPDAEAVGEAEDRPELLVASQDSTASSVYGDENTDPSTLASVSEPNLAEVPSIPATASPTRRPLNNFTTPSRHQAPTSRFAHTVISKVPLRAEGQESPIKLPKKRSRSLSADPSSAKRTPAPHASALPRSTTLHTFPPTPTQTDRTASPPTTTPTQHTFTLDDFGDSTLDQITIHEDDENLPPITPTAALAAPTPSKKPPRPQVPAVAAAAAAATIETAPILLGAVIFVDVHTTEGADASGIFIELLGQMGAKCVKNWSWNARAEAAAVVHPPFSSGAGAVAVAGMAAAGAKIGITHVVYKDGGVRTLEKVRDSEGVVRCVGVGWVLDCEREGKWLDESAYAVDLSILPRGGSRRRKSMEPRALLNLNGSLARVAAPARTVSVEMKRLLMDELVRTPVRGLGAAQGRGGLLGIDGDREGVRHCGSGGVEGDVEGEGAVEAEVAGDDESGFSTPSSLSISEADVGIVRGPATPTGFVNYDPSAAAAAASSYETPNRANGAGDTAAYSPTTPYYLQQGAKLVQMTCPPKQTGRGLFDPENADEGEEEGEMAAHRAGRAGAGAGGGDVRSGLGSGSGLGAGSGSEAVRRPGFPVSGQLADVKDEVLRKRLAEARRRTMGWRPRVASPLGR